MSKNLEETYLCGGHNTPYPILVIGLTYLSKKRGLEPVPTSPYIPTAQNSALFNAQHAYYILKKHMCSLHM